MSNLNFMLYENLQFIEYMLNNNYDKEVITDYIHYNLNLIENTKGEN